MLGQVMSQEPIEEPRRPIMASYATDFFPKTPAPTAEDERNYRAYWRGLALAPSDTSNFYPVFSPERKAGPPGGDAGDSVRDWLANQEGSSDYYREVTSNFYALAGRADHPKEHE